MITEITGGVEPLAHFHFSLDILALKRWYDLDCVIASSCTTSNGDKHRPFQLLCYSFSFCIHSATGSLGPDELDRVETAKQINNYTFRVEQHVHHLLWMWNWINGHERLLPGFLVLHTRARDQTQPQKAKEGR